MTVTDGDSSDRARADAERAEEDKALTHAVFFNDSSTGYHYVLAGKISAGLKSINDRALRAGMVVVSTQVLQTSYCTLQGVGHVCTTVVCQWMDHEALQSLQRQQALMGRK